jgi:hypothetical protein
VENVRRRDLRFDWTVTALVSTTIAGFYIDLWAHQHGRTDNILLTQWVPVVIAPAHADLAVELIEHAGLREGDARPAGRTRERGLRIRALRPVVRAPGLHDPPVFGELQVLALEVVADLEHATDAAAHRRGLVR